MPHAALRLAAVAASASQARRWARAWLAGGGPIDLDAVELVVSELVTNAVLHAGTDIEVTLRRDGASVTVEVADRSPTPPVPSASGRGLHGDGESSPAVVAPPGDDLGALLDQGATTGRGLRMIEVVAGSWGWRPEPGGKVVWARFGPDAGDGPAAPAAAGPATPASSLRSGGGTRPEGDGPVVCLLALPVRLLAEWALDVEAMVRELQVAVSGGSAEQLSELLTATSATLGRLSGQRRAIGDAMRAAIGRGDRAVDVEVAYPPAAVAADGELLQLMSEIGRLAERGDMLVAGPSPEARAFRRWMHLEVVRQAAGATPRPCPFTAHEPHDAADPEVAYVSAGDATQVHRRDLAVLDALMHDASMGVAVLDAEGRYLSVNAVLAAANGPSPADHLGRSIEEVLGEGAADVRALVDRVMATGRAVPAGDVRVTDATGTVRTWRVLWLPWHDAGRVAGVIAIANDVTAEVIAASEQRRLYQRAALLARAAEALGASLAVPDAVRACLDLLVPAVADWGLVHLLDDDGTVRLAGTRHRDASVEPALQQLLEGFEVRLDHRYGAGWVIANGQAQRVTEITDDMVTTAVGVDPEVVAALRAQTLGAGLVVPLSARGRTFGAISVVHTEHRGFAAADDDLVVDLALRAGLAIDNARLFEHQRDVATTLQQSLLPRRLDPPPGVEVTARYLPGVQGMAVGGDWYDVVRVDGGRVWFVVGDVMGRGVRAAALMGQLRAALLAWARIGQSAAEVLSNLDGLIDELDPAAIATVAVAEVDLPGRRLRLTRAGHLPLVVRDAAGARLVDGAIGPPLGAGGGDRAGAPWCAVAPGSLLVACTDGLVEDRRRPIGDGLASLVDAVAGSPDGLDAAADHLLAAMGRQGGHDDDVAVLVARLA